MLRFDRMLFGSRSAAALYGPPAVPLTPGDGTPEVVAPVPGAGAVAVGAPSSTGAGFSSVLLQPAISAKANAMMIQLRMIFLLGWSGQRGSGPQAGSRTSAAGETSRCLTRPSEDTPANIPRDPCCAA